MIILTIRTDQPNAELGLYNNDAKLIDVEWTAHRQLAETLHQQITHLLSREDMRVQDIEGIIVFAGPGSFTGLRIGISVANALAYALNVPIACGMGKDWVKEARDQLNQPNRPDSKYVIPVYGAPVHLTLPRK